MMLHPSNISGYREIMLAARKRRAHEQFLLWSDYLCGSLLGAGLAYSGWLF